MKVLFVNAEDSSEHVRSANAGTFPNLGLLTLMSALIARIARQDVGYLDGTVVGNEVIRQFILANAATLSVICFSSVTANYAASLAYARLAKELNPKVITIFGNDHFSALFERVMSNRPEVDYGFYGHDVVQGFARFVTDCLADHTIDLTAYPGLVFRGQSTICRNREDPGEYGRLPLVDYHLMDMTVPHREKYLANQQKHGFMREHALSGTVVDIGRGCIRFAGKRENEIPCKACDFCGIIPGAKAIATPSPERAWRILENAHDQGFNYFLVTADELPLTVWNLLRSMAQNKPRWFRALKVKPKMFGYARAEAFEKWPDRVNVLADLGVYLFSIGFDAMSDVSLRALNKRTVARHNLLALQAVASKNCLVLASIVLTHLGITRQIMAENFRLLEECVSAYPHVFAAMDFSPLCPVPGSRSFRYLTHPDAADARARELGLRIDRSYLDSVQDKYRNGDCFSPEELVHDFIAGCCPDIDQQDVDEYLKKLTDLASRHRIVTGGGI